MLFYEFLHIILTAIAKNVNNAAIFFNKRAMRNIDRKIKHIPTLTAEWIFALLQ